MLLGVGLGPLQSLFGVAVQNAVGREKIGVVTSANQFFRQIGSTVGVALFGALLTTGMNARLAAWAMQNGRPPLDLSQLRTLSANAQTQAGMMDLPEPVRAIITGSVTHVILLSAIVVCVALAATFQIPELPMHKAPSPRGEPTPNAHL